MKEICLTLPIHSFTGDTENLTKPLRNQYWSVTFFVRKYKEKQIICGHYTVTEGGLVIQLFGNTWVSVWRIVWFTTYCCFLSDISPLSPSSLSSRRDIQEFPHLLWTENSIIFNFFWRFIIPLCWLHNWRIKSCHHNYSKNRYYRNIVAYGLLFFDPFSWIWRQQVSPKNFYLSTRLNGVTSTIK